MVDNDPSRQIQSFEQAMALIDSVDAEQFSLPRLQETLQRRPDEQGNDQTYIDRLYRAGQILRKKIQDLETAKLFVDTQSGPLTQEVILFGNKYFAKKGQLDFALRDLGNAVRRLQGQSPIAPTMGDTQPIVPVSPVAPSPRFEAQPQPPASRPRSERPSLVTELLTSATEAVKKKVPHPGQTISHILFKKSWESPTFARLTEVVQAGVLDPGFKEVFTFGSNQLLQLVEDYGRGARLQPREYAGIYIFAGALRLLAEAGVFKTALQPAEVLAQFVPNKSGVGERAHRFVERYKNNPQFKEALMVWIKYNWSTVADSNILSILPKDADTANQANPDTGQGTSSHEITLPDVTGHRAPAPKAFDRIHKPETTPPAAPGPAEPAPTAAAQPHAPEAPAPAATAPAAGETKPVRLTDEELKTKFQLTDQELNRAKLMNTTPEVARARLSSITKSNYAEALNKMTLAVLVVKGSEEDKTKLHELAQTL